MDVAVDDREGAAQFEGCWRVVGGDARPKEPVVDLGVEDGDTQPVAGELVGVRVLTALEQPVAAQAGQVP